MLFRLKSEPIQLVQLLKAAGVCMTGGEAKILVEEGEVQVDGAVETRKRRQLFAGMVVRVGEETIELQAPESAPNHGLANS